MFKKVNINPSMFIFFLPCQAFSGSALIAGVVFNSSLGFPNTNEEAKEVIETNRSDAHKVVLWVMSAAAVGFIIQFLVIVGRFLNFEFVRSFSSLVHVLVSSCSHFLCILPCILPCILCLLPLYIHTVTITVGHHIKCDLHFSVFHFDNTPGCLLQESFTTAENSSSG